MIHLTWRTKHFRTNLIHRKKQSSIFYIVFSFFKLILTGIVLATADQWGYAPETPNGVIEGKSNSEARGWLYQFRSRNLFDTVLWISRGFIQSWSCLWMKASSLFFHLLITIKHHKIILNVLKPQILRGIFHFLASWCVGCIQSCELVFEASQARKKYEKIRQKIHYNREHASRMQSN